MWADPIFLLYHFKAHLQIFLEATQNLMLRIAWVFLHDIIKWIRPELMYHVQTELGVYNFLTSR